MHKLRNSIAMLGFAALLACSTIACSTIDAIIPGASDAIAENDETALASAYVAHGSASAVTAQLLQAGAISRDTAISVRGKLDVAWTLLKTAESQIAAAKLVEGVQRQELLSQARQSRLKAGDAIADAKRLQEGKVQQ